MPWEVPRMSDDVYRPPPHPFYEERGRGKRRKPVIVNRRPEYYERLRKMLADELERPVSERTGKLRTLKSGDLSQAEVDEIKRRYKLK